MEERSGKYSITKTVEFCGAHKLPWHKGACKNLHGHLWRIEVTVSRKDGDLDKNENVFDLGVLGGILQVIADSLDHSYLNDTFENPTAENIAKSFFEKTTYWLPTDVDVKRVVVEESPGSKVTMEC